jgi:ATP-dependent helicase HrpB
MLGALDASGSATPHGRAMAALPVHPRIAHMLISARSKGAGALACDVAAILGERDFLRGTGAPADADIEIRLELMHAPAPPRSVFGAEVDVPLVRRAIAESAALRRELGIKSDTGNAGVSAGVVLALAYPDRIAQSRGDSSGARFLLRNGRGATLTHPQGLSAAQHLVAATLDGDAQSARIFLGASLTRAEIEAHFSDQMETDRVVEWDERLQSVRTLKRVRLGAIVLTESAASGQDTTATTGVLLGIVRRDGIGALPWSDGAVRLRARVAFMRAHHADWPDVSDAALLAGLDDWLAPILAGRTSLRELKPHLDHAIMAMVGWERREELDRLAPTHYVAPTGTRVAIDYGDPEAPSVAIRLQEMFGARDTPTIDGGHVPLTLELLSPARRPVQVTRDLAGFWRGSYFDVRKEMRGRYPRHAWPDDPLSATPTPRAKRRGE